MTMDELPARQLLPTPNKRDNPHGAPSSDRPRAAPRYRLGLDTHLLIHDGQARLFDLGRGRFYSLDAVGTHMLTRALQADDEEVATWVADAYGVAPEQAAEDWACLSRTLQRKGLLAAASSRGRLPGKVRLFLLLTLAWLSIRLFGWVGSIRLWQRGRQPVTVDWNTPGNFDMIQTVSLRGAGGVGRPSAEYGVQGAIAGGLARLAQPLRAGRGTRGRRHGVSYSAHAWVECGPWSVTDERGKL